MTAPRAVATNLRCEYLKDPLAIDAGQPRLSWEMDSDAPGAAQSAYRLIAADSKAALKSNHGNLWDSGKVESSQSMHVHYAGTPLASCQQVFWKVKLWDEQGRAGRWTKAATFTMGLLDQSEWQGEWIGNYLGNTHTSPLLRKEFALRGKVTRALFHATACGIYHLTLNGKAVHDDLFAPGWTDFKKRRYYRCYDLTRQLQRGEQHCLGAELGDGWYREWYGGWGNDKKRYGTNVTLLGQLRIEYEDGTIEIVPTDTSWQSILGPTTQSGFYNGESVDAQLEPKGWGRVGFDTKGWSAAVSRPAGGQDVPLQCYPAEPVRVTEELKPLKQWSVAPGKVIYDFGQNFAGRVRLHVKGKAGTVVRLRFGEMVNLDDTLYIDNMRSAICTDTYVMKGATREVWEPKFTFHGFRYVEVTGCPVPPSLDNVTGVVIGSDTTRVGDFDCSSPMINQLYSNAVWTQRANFLEVPTDCPQRDERLGWTGDAQVFIRTAICNMDVAAFFTKWMNDLLDAQTPDGAFPNVAPDVLDSKGGAAWGDAGVVCPWTLYQCYEDRDLLATMYPAMKRWVAYLRKTSNKLLCESTQCFGDWLHIKANTPKPVIRTAHFAYATDITRKAAEVLGKKADAARYATLFADIKTVFNKAFVAKDGKIEGDTQTAYLMALKFGLLSPKRAEQAAKHLVADIRRKKMHSSTGFVGTGLIMSVLRDTGNLDVAYRLLENTTFPSWGYSVVNGATSIWERWNGWTKEDGPGDVNMNSYSHYAYGAVVEWMFDTIAGIDHRGSGFQHFTLRPQPGGSLKHATATYRSPYGTIRSAWRKRGKQMRYEVTIPANTQATVMLPVKELAAVKLDGKSLQAQGIAVTADSSFELAAGEYVMTWRG
ncbi:MAG: family 78 glycoside hydrolase catalytic domain [Verrucomicrobia bacterium]|jgi:alpha-L-rhamnosidase|nr:family 78 glycoside hydrolase catalytic domain [Verrucomicrobiota bacterium]MBT7700408.1 family 78 glycoside hydrolase catalytic domain [Verrucomicrobiota bacterium]